MIDIALPRCSVMNISPIIDGFRTSVCQTNCTTKICFIGMGICLVYGKAKCLPFHSSLADLTTGAAVGAMGYPTPLPPADASEEEQLQFIPTSTELIGKVSPPILLHFRIIRTESPVQLQFAFQLLMVTCYGFVKISIVCFYPRMFVPFKGTTFDIITTIVIVIMFLWSLTFILIVMFDCGAKILASWGTPAAQEAYCAVIGHTSEEGLAGSDLILEVVLIIFYHCTPVMIPRRIAFVIRLFPTRTRNITRHCHPAQGL